MSCLLRHGLAQRLGLWFSPLLLSTAVWGQAPPATNPPTFSEEAQVLVRDVMVEVTRQDTFRRGADAFPKDLKPEDLTVTLGGEVLPVLALQPSDSDPELWRVLLYIDAVLASDGEIRRTAEMWFSQAEALTTLGTVEIQVADPEPRVVLEPTRNTKNLAEALSRLRLRGQGQHALVNLRQTYLGETPATAEAPEQVRDREDPPLTPEAALLIEERLGQQRLDVLALLLAEEDQPTARKVLFWVGTGLDLEPSRFYEEETGTGESEDEKAPAEGLAQLAAAYGWIAFSHAEAPPENRANLKPGLRIGKLRINRTHKFPFLLGIHVNYEEDRDAKKAEAFLEIGETLLDQAKPAEAEENLRQAIFHFYGDPRTAELQIRTYEAWAQALEQLGEEQKARQAREAALELRSGAAAPADTTLAEGSLTSDLPLRAGAADIDGLPLARMLAEATAGAVLRESRDLPEALESLSRRLRLTVQQSGPADGALKPLTLKASTPKVTLRSPAWARSGSPEVLAEARLRALLTSELALGADRLLDSWELGWSDHEEQILRFTDQKSGSHPGPWRLSLGYADREEVLQVEHQTLDDRHPPTTIQLFPPSSPLGLDSLPVVLVLLEDLPSGRWAATAVERE